MRNAKYVTGEPVPYALRISHYVINGASLTRDIRHVYVIGNQTRTRSVSYVYKRFYHRVVLPYR